MSAITVERGRPPPPAKPENTPSEPMPGGIAASAGLHIGLFVLILLGLPSLFRPPPPQDVPIAVDLVTIAPETRATQPNPFRPKPEAKPEPAVAAPAPKPEPKPEPPVPAEPPSAAAPPPIPAPPQPKPEVKPTPAPPPPPPKPVAAQAPPPPPPPETKPRPQPQRVAHHVPRAEAKKSDPAAFEKVLNNLQDKKPAPADFDSLLKNLTRDQAAPADEAPPRPRQRVTAAAPPSSQPKAPLGAQLTASELDALREQIMRQLIPCWNVPAGIRDAKDLVVEIHAVVTQDGTVQQAAIVGAGLGGDPAYRAAAESARRTFFNPQCTPLKLPPEKYELWKELYVRFSPKDIL
jgi:hypothetical protein